MNKLTANGRSNGILDPLDTGSNDAASKRVALALINPVPVLKPSAATHGASILKTGSQRRTCKGKSSNNASISAGIGHSPGKAAPENGVDELLKLLGVAVLLEVERCSKRPSRAWKHLTLDKQTPERLDELRRHAENGGNIGVALGEVSKGLCTIDFDTEPEAEDFLKVNPKLDTALRTCGSRGYQIWVRIIGMFPKSIVVKRGDNRDKMAEWRANGNQSIVLGTHPSGNQYKRLKNSPPVELLFNEIIWPVGWIIPAYPANVAAIQKHTHTEEVPLYGGLYGSSPVDATKEIEVTVDGRKDKPAKLGCPTLEQAHPQLPAFYDERIGRKHTPKPRERYAFLLAAVPFLHCAVAKEIMLLFVGKYYGDNAAIFRDPLQTHLQEAEGIWNGSEHTFINTLSETELGVYNKLLPDKKTAFRICRRLAYGRDGSKTYKGFFLSGRNLCIRLGKRDDKFAWHLLKEFKAQGIIVCTKKGTAHTPGNRGKASEYEWNLL